MDIGEAVVETDRARVQQDLKEVIVEEVVWE
jgi:hypothetical protein